MKPRLFSFASTALLKSAPALIVIAFASGVTQAASRFWDLNGVTAGLGAGSGTWDLSATNWNTATAGTATTVAFAIVDDAFFQTAGANNPVTLGVDLTANSITQTTGGTATTINSGGGTQITLTTGNITNSGNQPFVINPNIVLGANGTINASNAITLAGVVSGSGFGFTKTGGNTLTLAGANTYTGATTIGTAGSAGSAGTLTVSGAAGSIATSSGITINGSGSRLLLDNTAGNVDRIINTGAVNLSVGGELSLTGNATTATSETFGSLAVGSGNQIVTIASAAGLVTTLNAGAVSNAFTRTGNGTALIRGTSLDQSAATNVSQFTLGDGGASLTFVGTNTLNNGTVSDATQAVKIVPYLFGDTAVGGNGKNFVTYDTTLGLRVLNATEGTTLADVSTTEASPVNAVAFSGIVTNPGLTVNSLLFNAASQTLDGSGALTINSGAVAAVANNAFIDIGFSSLVLGNGEGVITATTGNTLTISTPISVTASGGLTKAGGGTLRLGAASHSYTGTTTINQGTLSYINAANESFGALNGVGTVQNAAGAGTLAFTQAASTTYNIGTITNSTTSGATGAFTLNAGASSGTTSTTIATINGTSTSVVNLGGNSTGITNITNVLNTAGQTVNFNAGTVNLNGTGAFGSTMVVNGATVNTASATANNINFQNVVNLQVLSGTLNVRQLNGLRIGNQFGAQLPNGASNATALQSGGIINFTNSASFSLGNNATTGPFTATFALSGGLFDSSTSTGTILIGAGATGGGISSFNFSGGTLLWRGTISGSQGAGAQQSFVWTGGTLAVGTYTATNLTSTQGTAVVIGTTNTLTNAGGILAPGGVGTGGITLITGNYNVTPLTAASYAVDIGSATAAAAFQSGAAFYDTTTVSGTVVLGGTLNVSLINGFTPAAQSFTILTGTSFTGSFSNVSGGKVSLAGGATFDVTVVGGNTVVLNNYTAAASNTYASWIGGFGVGGQTGANQDFDNDNLSNSVENVLGSNPSVYSAGLTQISATASSVKFRHNQSNTIATDVTGSYQWSPDLVNWAASGVSIGATTATIGHVTITDVNAPANDLIEVTVTVTTGPATKLFGRLVATKAP